MFLPGASAEAADCAPSAAPGFTLSARPIDSPGGTTQRKIREKYDKNNQMAENGNNRIHSVIMLSIIFIMSRWIRIDMMYLG